MSKQQIGHVSPTPIEKEVQASFLDYAMSVIVSRALPDARDGLKPVHRRILYAMYSEGLTPDRRYSKSAGVVGEVIKKYHPHGDAAVYDALVRMVQDFNMRHPLVDGQGNFGSVDGDPPAAYRYTEVRLAPLAMEMLADIDKETVDFVDNFDGSTQEPVVLPASIPNLLVNGSAGIAVGMATNIPPHNLGEVVDAICHLIKNPDAEISDLMQFIPGPDFPTAGLIQGTQGIRKAYHEGNGSLVIRGRHEIEESASGRERIVITELPYQVNKANLVEKIAVLVRDKKIVGIQELRDESDRHGMRVVLELKRDAQAPTVVNALCKHTQFQSSFGILLLALVDGAPKVLNLKQALQVYIDHRKEIVTRRSRFELEKAKQRAHIVEGLKIALQHLDEVIAIIRKAESPEDAKQKLMRRFKLSEAQTQAILEMRLGRLTRLEQSKLDEEYKELLKTINRLEDLLSHERKILQVVGEELQQIKKKYANPRRTLITEASGDISVEELIPREDVIFTLSRGGYIKRMGGQFARAQRRGGKGIIGATTKEEDQVEQIAFANTHDNILFFTNTGKVYRLKGYEIPEHTRQSKGKPLVNFIQISQNERVTSMLGCPPQEEPGFLFMVTRRGVVKKTAFAEFENVPKAGKIAVKLDEGDELEWVDIVLPKDHVFLASQKGQTIRFKQEQVRPMGRAARGIRGMSLRKGDAVVAMVVLGESEKADMLFITSRGYGKRVAFEAFRPQNRGGMGVRGIKLTSKSGDLVKALLVGADDDIICISRKGIVLRTFASQISCQGRNAAGVRTMKLEDDDEVVDAEVLSQGGEQIA